MDRSDNELVTDTLIGDPGAFEILVRRHQSRVFFLGLKFLRNYENAEDFTQDVFLRAFEKLHTFRGTTRFAAWLYRLAFNHGVNLYRGGKRKFLEAPELDPETIPSSEQGPEKQLDDTETADRVNDVIARLPPVYAVVIRMRYYDDLEYKEMAEILGVPLNTVKSHLRRAKERVRRETGSLFEEQTDEKAGQ